MSRRAFRQRILTTAAVVLAIAATPVAAGDDKTDSTKKQSSRTESVRDDRDVGDTLSDAWLVTKVKAQFWDEDALDDSDINVDAREGVITLRGTVVSQAGKARALAIARSTEGVKRVEDRLSIGASARDDDADDDTEATSGIADDTRREAGETADEVKKEAREVAAETKQATKKASDKSKDAVATAGEAVTDGWITAKVKSSFVGEDALENSEIDVDTNNGIVTLAGTVASQAGRARAEAIAKKIEGVKQVRNELEVGSEK